VALAGWGSAGLQVSARDRWLGWSDSQRRDRLRFVANNQRFCVLGEQPPSNLASGVLARSLRRLPVDFTRLWGFPVLLAETFVDPSRHVGTCYRAANFTYVGDTSGWSRRHDTWVWNGQPKRVYVRELHRYARRLLSGPDPGGVLVGRDLSTMTPTRKAAVIAEINQLDLTSPGGLLERIAREVPDPRDPRGIRHSVTSIVAIAAVAVIGGAKSFRAIGEAAADLPAQVLERLRCRVRPNSGNVRVAPAESTIRRNLARLDGDALDRCLNRWLLDELAAGRLDPDGELAAIALDGKWLRGTAKQGSDQVKLFAAVIHGTGTVAAQTQVDDTSNETTAFGPLLDELGDLDGAVITADAAHTSTRNARSVVDRNGHYLLQVKKNQPKLYETVTTLDPGSFSP
jgi:hypothetical protein